MKHATSNIFIDQVGTLIKVYKHETKQMVNTRTYDTFGKLVNQTGSSTGNLGFQSKYYDQESGLNYFYHRYYYPNIGRFINEDPIGFHGKENFYVFEKNCPENMIDPYGLRYYCNGRWRKVGQARLINTIIPGYNCVCYWLCYPCDQNETIIYSPNNYPVTSGIMTHTGGDIQRGDTCMCFKKPGPEKGCPECEKKKYKGEYYFKSDLK
jgi:RHS repeat-associated protein